MAMESTESKGRHVLLHLRVCIAAVNLSLCKYMLVYNFTFMHLTFLCCLQTVFCIFVKQKVASLHYICSS